MTNQWKDIPDVDGYQASTEGKIRSIKRTNNPIIIKPHISKGKNYERILLCVGGKAKSFLVHRLVASTFIPNPLNLTDTHHHDADKFNNHVDNLSWVSHRDNVLKDQGKTLICTHLDGRILEITGGKIASKELGISRRTILSAVKSGRTTKFGWSFKYKK